MVHLQRRVTIKGRFLAFIQNIVLTLHSFFVRFRATMRCMKSYNSHLFLVSVMQNFCSRCEKAVYFAEAIQAMGKYFHRKCFICCKIFPFFDFRESGRLSYLRKIHSVFFQLKRIVDGASTVEQATNTKDRCRFYSFTWRIWLFSLPNLIDV